MDEADVFLAKAQESLAGAESEYAYGRYNNCANRCYYACFQGAIYALVKAGITQVSAHAQWGHAFVQAQFIGQLINRRKMYPAGLRDVLARTLALRVAADYEVDTVSAIRASRALRSTQHFLEAVRPQGGDAA